MFENIIVGYAGDRAGADAVAFAVKLAQPLQSKLTVVFPYHPLFAGMPADVAEQRVRDELKAIAPDSQSLARATCHWSNSQWPIRALHELAEYEHCDLIVFGGAKEGLTDHLHVSLMERMVHGAPGAVLVAPAGYAEHPPGPLRHIGVGFSDSDEGIRALQTGHWLAATLDGDLRVIAASWLSPVIRGYAAQAAPVSSLEAEDYAATQASLERAVEQLEDASVDARAIKGNPVEVLVEHSETLDLLVLGSRAYGPLRHVLLGTVSAAVMREAHCPVLVIPRSG